MKRAGAPETKPERHVPGDRLSRINQASIRTSETLDLDTVLQGVVNGARSLTSARYGGVTAREDRNSRQS